MRSIVRCFGVAALVAAAPSYIAPASATAFAGVNEAIWSASFEYYQSADGSTSALPSGVTVNCFGGAQSFALSCYNEASLTLSNNSAADLKKSLSQISGFSITNNSGSALDGNLVFIIGFSAFNPGGNEIGASVDNSSKEYASFSSSVVGPSSGDQHDCSVGGEPGAIGPEACGVDSPDSSSTELFLDPLAVGEKVLETYNINIDLEARGVPEPFTLSFFGVGLVGAAAMRRRMRKA